MYTFQPITLYEEKKSKFFGYFFDIEKEGQIDEILAMLKKEHKKATHICYAVIFSGETFITKACDAGEPSGTAGRPILNVLQKQNKTNCLLAVVRYFGGVKLGAGGLVRAYTKTAAQTLLEVGSGNN